MIRMFLNKNMSAGSPLFKKAWPPFHSKYCFCAKKPEGGDGNEGDEPAVPPHNSEKKKLKIYFGNQKQYPLLKTIKQHLWKYQGFDKKMKKGDSRVEKKKQEEAEKEKSGKQRRQKIKNWLFFIVLFLLLTSPSDAQNNKRQTFNSIDYDAILKEIQATQDFVEVFISKAHYEPFKIQIKLSPMREPLELKTNELGIVHFLEKLQDIKGGTVKVSFNFAYPQPGHRVDPKHLIEAGMLAILFMTGIVLFNAIQKANKGGAGGLANMFQMKKIQPIKPEDISIYFKDVAGMHQAKFQVTEFVDFLKQPDRYIEMGAKIPKGALLTGPPGTGKTLLAKACAGEAGVPFFSVSGSDFVEKFSGLGAARIRDLFEKAEKIAPSIIFIDEIDAIGKKRDAGPFSNEERDNTLNQLLVKMDGFNTKNKVIVMAATNRKDMLDPALLRPGRFDRSVQIGLPNFEQRQQILKVHLKKVKYDQNITEAEIAKKIATITPGFSGAELANTCNEAAILAARDNLKFIPFEKFEKATERVMAGLEKRNMFTEEEKEMLAYYQCGKAVASWFTEGSDPTIKISILPFSKSSSGYSHSIKDQTALHTKKQLLAKACCYLAGRSSELHFKGYITTNGNKDLQRAKKIITMIVTKFGMSDSLKMMAFPDFDFIRKPYSEKTEALIDEQIMKITTQCQQRVQNLIKSKQKQIKMLKDKLLQHETLTHNQIKELLGERPAGTNRNYEEYLKDQEKPVDDGSGVGAGTV